MSSGGRVLVTGGTGAFGIATTRWLSRLGHDAVVFARRAPTSLPRGATFAQGDIRDADSVRRAMQGCDAVVHLAWAVSGFISLEEAEPLNLGGTRHVLQAMTDTGCERLVFASSLTAYGAHPEHPQPWHEDEELHPDPAMAYEFHKARAEDLIVASGVPAVRVRPTVVVGRHAHNDPANVYRQLMIPDIGWGMQAIHQDDCGRFFAEACAATSVGAVNLAADDVVSWAEIAQLCRRRRLPLNRRAVTAVLRGAAKVLPKASSAPALYDLMAYFPIGDTTRLRKEFGFTVAFSSAEAFADLGRTSTSHILLGFTEIRRPSRLDRVPDPGQADSDPAGASIVAIDPAMAGEFDTVHVDPRFPHWTADNLAEAFPGPMTPLSMELALEGLRSSADLIAGILPVPPALAADLSGRHLGTFGHRLYTNVSVVEALVETIPGQTPEDFRYQTMGIPYPEDFQRPKPTPRDVLGFASFAVRSGPQLAGLDKAAARSVARAHEVASWTDTGTLPDERLLARISVLWDDTVSAWQIGNTCTFMVSGPTAILERKYGREAVLGLKSTSGTLPSARLLHGINRLAGTARSDAAVRDLLTGSPDDGAMDRLRDTAPGFARAVDVLLADCGHRGPGETELANKVYADSPALLLRTIARSSGDRTSGVAPSPPLTGLAARLGKLALKAIARREHARDAVTLTTHQLRKALREWERRLIERGRLTAPGDIFYLRSDEVYAANARDFTDVVTRRRAERIRLAALTMPAEFSGTISFAAGPVGGTSEQHGVLTGIPASPGTVRGRVRLMTSPEDDLDEGDILVTSATDTGWTPFFGVAGAVVTEFGGLMSHASIVAREFGIPAVVGLTGACVRLQTGQLVEVDGSAGTVTFLDGF